MYCSGCGNQLQGDEKFCPECGKSTSNEKSSPEKKEEFETLEFKSSILLGGSILSPEKLIITDTAVVYRKRNKYLIGTDESSIPFSRISSVEINRKLIDSDILIYSTGNQKIVAQDFSISSAKEIKSEIERRINR
ncbi:MAG: hypothetical protein PHQ74_09915 [Crocinitomicaceae bacterium]|nr:hypothetical protein [Crocinitomicaceae bacterium]